MGLNRFNSIAPYYDELAQLVFGASIKKSHMHYLNQIPDKANILVIGGGTGRWLKELQQLKPTSKIWFIEASSTMLNKARKVAEADVTFIHGTETDVPPIQFDVIIAHFFLDLFCDREMKLVIARLNMCLKSNGVWIVSDFVNNKLWHSVFLSIMYFFFRVLGAVDVSKLYSWQKNLADENLMCIDKANFFKGFITSGLYKKDSA